MDGKVPHARCKHTNTISADIYTTRAKLIFLQNVNFAIQINKCFFIIYARESLLQYLEYKILANLSWLPDPGYQIIAAKSWLPDPGYQIMGCSREITFWDCDPGMLSWESSLRTASLRLLFLVCSHGIAVLGLIPLEPSLELIPGNSLLVDRTQKRQTKFGNILKDSGAKKSYNDKYNPRHKIART